jgi:hypothetical protein
MKAIHTSQNLTIEHDLEQGRLVVTVSFHEEAIVGHAPATCPRCEGTVNVSLWEFEGPGSSNNYVWMTCGEDSRCLLDDEPLRWSKQVVFEDDWSDAK